MAITRYDRPAESNIVNTVTPIPFEQMMQAGQMMANQYDQGMDALQKVYDDTYNIKYIPESKDEQYVKQQVIPAAREIFEKYISQDMGNPLVRRQAIMDLNSKIDKQRINEIQESWTGWKEDQKNIIKQKQEGKYADFLETSYKGYDTSVSGIYRGITPAALDYRKKMETYFDNLEPDSYVDKNSGQIIAYIDEKKIAKTAQGNLQSFIESPEGRQKVMELQSRGITGKDQEKELLEYAKQVGREHLIRKVQGFVPEYMFKDNTKPEAPRPVSYSPTYSLSGTKQDEGPEVEDITGVKTKSRFGSFINGVVQSIRRDFATEGGEEMKKQEDATRKAFSDAFSKPVVSQEDKTPYYKKVERQARNFYNYKGKDETMNTKLVKDYIDHFYTQQRSTPVYEIPTDKAAEETNNLFYKNNLAANREFYDPEKAATPNNKMQYSEILKEYPKNEYLYSTIGALSANNPFFSAGRQIGIYKKDEKGEPMELVKTLYMGADEREKSLNNVQHNFHKINTEVSGEREYTDYALDGTKLDIKQARHDTPQGSPISIEITFKDKNGKDQYFGGANRLYNTSEEALEDFSKFYNKTNNY